MKKKRKQEGERDEKGKEKTKKKKQEKRKELKKQEKKKEKREQEGQGKTTRRKRGRRASKNIFISFYAHENKSKLMTSLDVHQVWAIMTKWAPDNRRFLLPVCVI